jgi:AcrR family transcriptional regulator
VSSRLDPPVRKRPVRQTGPVTDSRIPTNAECLNGAGPLAVGRPIEAGREGGHVTEMQRRRLLLAMCEVIAEDGLGGASVGRVCKRASVSRRTFYDLFEDREACLLATLEQTIEWLAKSVLPAYEHERNWTARIRAGLIALLECLDSAPGLARLCVVETLRAGAEVSELRKRILNLLTAAIDEGRLASKQEGALTPIGAQGVVGGVLAVLHARLLEEEHAPLVELVNPLMAMIVHPYLGAAAARCELEHAAPRPIRPVIEDASDPFEGLSIRFTYRTARVLATVATSPGSSNRFVADTSGILDEGQMSRLLTRLQRAGLVENHGEGKPKGEPNAWMLTQRGEAVHAVLGVKLS